MMAIPTGQSVGPINLHSRGLVPVVFISFLDVYVTRYMKT